MDYAYTFGDPSTLYLNVTNQCTNHCDFCVRHYGQGLGGAQLWGGSEPDLDGLLDAINEYGNLEDLDEVVWCGFGEPTFRLDLICEASRIFKDHGLSVRLNTNGHGSLIQGRNIVPELAQAVDILSVSLNAPSAERYAEICQPDLKKLNLEKPTEVFEAVKSFISEAAESGAEVRVSVVGHVLDAHEIRSSEKLAESLGCHEFFVR